MNKGVAVISEFNPFHNGHKYLFDKIGERYPDKPIVCIMSSNLVQRGDVAIADKYKRAEMAIKCGANLVIELPFPFSTLSADAFAREGMYIANKSGLCDTVSFGVEIDDENVLYTAAKRIISDEFEKQFSKVISENKNLSFASARDAAYFLTYGEKLPNFPNFNLALQYCIEIFEKNYGFEIYPVKRYMCGFSDFEPNGEYASASYLRKKIMAGEISEIEKYMPKAAYDILLSEIENGSAPADLNALSKTFVYLLRKSEREELLSLYGFTGIAERAKKYQYDIFDISSFISKLNSAKFPDSRLRRCVISLLFDIKRGAESHHPSYTLLLGADEKGIKLLSERKESDFMIFTKPSHVLSSKNLSVQYEGNASFLADSIYTECFPKNTDGAIFLKKSPFIKK